MAEQLIEAKAMPFTKDMARAVRLNRKTETRRPLTVQPSDLNIIAQIAEAEGFWEVYPISMMGGCMPIREVKPRYHVGQVLWMQEPFYFDMMPWAQDLRSLKTVPEEYQDTDYLYYHADGECCEQIPECCCAEVGKVHWRAARYMPRWCCRQLLVVTEVRCERLQEITDEEAVREGLSDSGDPDASCPACRGFGVVGYDCDSSRDCPVRCSTAVGKFRVIWDALYASKGLGWDANPCVWCYGFETTDG